MNLKTDRIGRRRFIFTYFGTLGLRVLAVIIVSVILAGLKVSHASFGIGMVVAWIAVDVGMLPAYAARLNDVDLSRYCLWLLYLRHVYVPMIVFLCIATPPSEMPSALFTHPLYLILIAVFAVEWIIAIIMLVYLFFKKGEFYGTA